MIDTVNFTEEEKKEYELFLQIKNSAEYGILPLPARWYEKFGVPPVKHMTVREFYESNYTLNCAFASKDLPPLIIDEPLQNGKLVELIKEEPIPITVVETPYDPKVRRTEEEILELVKNKQLTLTEVSHKEEQDV